MRRRQGTRRVYFKDNFYESTFTSLPSRNWAHLFGTNAWAWSDTHPDAATYYPWDSNYHMGNIMRTPNAVGYHFAIATNTTSNRNSTLQPYLDAVSGDGGLEPVIYEYRLNRGAITGDMTFVFFYDTGTGKGLGIRHHNTGGAGTAVVDFVEVDLTVPAIPVFTVLVTYAVNDPTMDWTCMRVYYTPIDLKYGGTTVASAWTIRIFMSEGDVAHQPQHWLEGKDAVGSRYILDFGDFSIPAGVGRRSSGNNLGILVGPSTAGYINGIKYCRHWDYGLESLTYKNRLTIGTGFLNMILTKPRDEIFNTSHDAQIGYELGDRIEVQIKSRFRSYADPPLESHMASIIDFDGFIDDIKHKAGTQDRVDLTAVCGYAALTKHAEHFTFAGASTLLAAYQTLAPLATYKFNIYPWNGYGIDPALAGVNFAGAKDFKGLQGGDVVRRLNLFANTWSWWHPEGTWVVSTAFPNDASYDMNVYDATQNQHIMHWEEVQQGRKMLSNVVVMGGGATQTRSDASSGETYGDRSGQFIDQRETNTTDMQTIGDNLVNAWKNKRRIIDVYTYAMRGEIRIGDIVTMTIPSLEISAVDYQVIDKRVTWGERFPTMSNVIVFRMCEYIDGSTPPIWYVGKEEELSNVFHTAREALGQHA